MAWATVPDGSVVVGQSSNETGGRAFRWTPNGMMSLGVLPGGVWSTAIALSSDGSVIVGQADLPDLGANYHAVRWTSSTGLVMLPELSGWPYSEALAVSADGSVIGGQSGNVNTTSVATLWTPSLGAVDLNQYLPSLGIDLTNWTLYGVAGISLDGRTLVGPGLHNGIPKPGSQPSPAAARPTSTTTATPAPTRTSKPSSPASPATAAHPAAPPTSTATATSAPTRTSTPSSESSRAEAAESWVPRVSDTGNHNLRLESTGSATWPHPTAGEFHPTTLSPAITYGNSPFCISINLDKHLLTR